MQKKILLVVLFILFASMCLAQEEITITTYYPSPSGSYNELETRTLWFGEERNGLVAFRYPNAAYDRRLRITAGRADTGDNDQGASIDLHGNHHATSAGRLDLVAGRGSYTSFWTSPGGVNAQERMRIDNQGNVGIGTAAPAGMLHLAGNAGEVNLLINRAANNAGGPHLRGLKSRGTQAAPAAIVSGDDLLLLRGFGWDGDSFAEAARITFDTEGAIDNVTTPGRITFHTATETNPSVLTERMRIDSRGFVGVGTTAPSERLQVNGSIRIVDGTQAAGRVLTSSANGTGSWRVPTITFRQTGFRSGAFTLNIGAHDFCALSTLRYGWEGQVCACEVDRGGNNNTWQIIEVSDGSVADRCNCGAVCLDF